jgi:hypothetical protein
VLRTESARHALEVCVTYFRTPFFLSISRALHPREFCITTISKRSANQLHKSRFFSGTF